MTTKRAVPPSYQIPERGSIQPLEVREGAAAGYGRQRSAQDVARDSFAKMASLFLSGPLQGNASRRAADKAFVDFEDAVTAVVRQALDQSAPPPATHAPGIEAAVQAGAELRATIFSGADMLTSDQLAAKLGVSRETVNKRRTDGQLLALSNGSRALRYPSWQLAAQVEPVLPRLLQVLQHYGPLDIYLFITQTNALLDDQTPLACLLAGEADRVIDAAQSYVDEMAVGP